MGANCTKELDKSDTDWDFVGRENDLEKVVSLIEDNRVVEVFGLLQIGKSRLLKQVIYKLRDDQSSQRKKKLLYFDFHLYKAEKGLVKCFNEALKTFDYVSENNVVALTDVHELVQIFSKAVDDGVIDNEEVIIFLDNLHVVIESASEKQTFLSFVKDIVLLTNVKFVVTTYVKIGFTFQWFVSYELSPMTYDEILELLHKITEGKYRADDKYMGPIYMPVLARLCAGLPLAAMITASELKDDDGFITPCDMVEIFFTKRLDAMSCKIYPEEDQLCIYKKQIKKVEEMTPYLVHTLKEIANNTSGTTLSIKDVQAIKSKSVAKGLLKQELRDLQRQGVVNNLSAEKMTIALNSVIRECTLFLNLETSINDLPEDERQEYQDQLLKCFKENVDMSEIGVPEDAYENPSKLAEFLQGLAAPCENKDVDDDITETKSEVQSMYQEADISNTSYTTIATSIEENNLDDTVSSTTDSLVDGAQAEVKIMNSGPDEYHVWNIPPDRATGSGSSSVTSQTAVSELNNEDYPSSAGPPAMPYKNESGSVSVTSHTAVSELNNEDYTSSAGPQAMPYKNVL